MGVLNEKRCNLLYNDKLNQLTKQKQKMNNKSRKQKLIIKRTRKLKGGAGWFDFLKSKPKPQPPSTLTSQLSSTQQLSLTKPPQLSQSQSQLSQLQKPPQQQPLSLTNPQSTVNNMLKEEDTSLATQIVKTSFAVGAVTTLGDIVSNALGNPLVAHTLLGVATTSIAFASCGGVAVAAIVIAAAWIIIKHRYRAYNGLILAMDELYLVLKKINGIVTVSVHIAETYGFPLDTRNVTIGLNLILSKLNKLMDPVTDFPTIKNNITTGLPALKAEFNAQEGDVMADMNERNTEVDVAPNPPTISLSYVTKLKNNLKRITFNASEYVEQLNETIAYLALHLSALSASFSIMYTTVVTQCMIDGPEGVGRLKELQAIVISANSFDSMLEMALIGPLQSSSKNYASCLHTVQSDKDRKCADGFISTAQKMQKYMLDKFDPTKNTNQTLYSNMPALKTLIQTNPNIADVQTATKFVNDVTDASLQDQNRMPSVAANNGSPTSNDE